MSIIEKERKKVIEGQTDLDPKIEQPKKYQVVLRIGTPFACYCHVNVLVDVFRKSAGEAYEHTTRALMSGKEAVFTASKDIVESKVLEANATKKWHEDDHSPIMAFTAFTCEPM